MGAMKLSRLLDARVSASDTLPNIGDTKVRSMNPRQYREVEVMAWKVAHKNAWTNTHLVAAQSYNIVDKGRQHTTICVAVCYTRI